MWCISHHRRWDSWLASPTQWTWVWASSMSWWWTGKPGMLESMGWQRVRHNWATELNWKKKKQTSQVNELLLCVWEDTRVWAYGNYSFVMHLSYPGPISWFFPFWVPSGYVVRGGCSSWGLKYALFTGVVWYGRQQISFIWRIYQ